MSRTSWDERWRERLKQDLEPVLKGPNISAEISTTQGVPFALFVYWPTAEQEARKEINMLARRVQHGTTRRVHQLSMAEMVHKAICAASPPNGQEIFDAERELADMPVERRLEDLQGQMEAILSTVSPLPSMILDWAADLSPDQDILFLTRVGALYPAYRASALLDHLMENLQTPTILFYPGSKAGTNMLAFMNSLEAKHSYRHKIF
jgi:hypothetical protein